MLTKTKTKKKLNGAKKAKTTAVAKRGTTAVGKPLESLRLEPGGGFEDADIDSYAIPFIAILQKNSPQCDDTKDEYVDGAKAGMFFNTATGELFDGTKGILVIPAHFRRSFVEWVPRDQGGGFRGSYGAHEIDMTKLKRDESSGRFLLENGNELRDTRYHFCVRLTGDPATSEFCIIGLTSTQIKKSRQWMTRLRMLKVPDGKGGKVTPPTYGSVWRLTTVGEENAKGSWRGWKITLDHILAGGEEALFDSAKAFLGQVKSKKAHVDDAASDAAGASEPTVEY